MLFKFYDNRNKSRLRKLRTRAERNFYQTEELLKQASALQSVLKRIDKMGSIKTDFKEKKTALTMQPEEFKEIVMAKIGAGFAEFFPKMFMQSGENEQPETSDKMKR